MSKVTTSVQAIAEKIFTAPEIKELAADLIHLALKPEIKADAVYNYRQVATLVGVSYMTIFRAAEAGYLKASYVGSEPRIRGAAVLRWLDDGGKTGRSKKNLIEEAA